MAQYCSPENYCRYCSIFLDVTMCLKISFNQHHLNKYYKIPSKEQWNNFEIWPGVFDEKIFKVFDTVVYWKLALALVSQVFFTNQHYSIWKKEVWIAFKCSSEWAIVTQGTQSEQTVWGLLDNANFKVSPNSFWQEHFLCQ